MNLVFFLTIHFNNSNLVSTQKLNSMEIKNENEKATNPSFNSYMP